MGGAVYHAPAKYLPSSSLNNVPRKGAFGTIYEQFKGKAKEAVAWLMQKKEGEAVGALHHKDIGDISLVWGNDKAGLKKILRKHPEVVDNLQGVIDGMEVVSSSANRVVLESDTHKAVVSKEFKGQPREKWLLTAYEKKETSEPAISSIDVESNQGGKSDDTATRQGSEVSDGKDTEVSSEKQAENGGSEDSVVAPKQEEAPTAPQMETVEKAKDEQVPDTEVGSGGGDANVPPTKPTVPALSGRMRGEVA